MWENHGMWQQRKRKETKSRLLTISFSGVCKKTHPVSLVDNFERIFKNMQNVIGLMMIWNLLWMNQPERHGVNEPTWKYGVHIKINLEGIGDPHLLPIDHQVISHSENVVWDSLKRFSNDWSRFQNLVGFSIVHLLAVVVAAATSLPPPGSLTPRQATWK